MILDLAICLPEDSTYIQFVRLMSRTMLEYLHVIKDDILDIELLVSELCANVSRHSHSSEGKFNVELKYFPEKVVVVIEDTGGGFSFKDIQPRGSTRYDFNGESRVGGFGMDLIEHFADRLEFRRTEPHGTTVCAEKYLHYETPSFELEAQKMG